MRIEGIKISYEKKGMKNRKKNECLKIEKEKRILYIYIYIYI